jgi:hypothetical protein
MRRDKISFIKKGRKGLLYLKDWVSKTDIEEIET